MILVTFVVKRKRNFPRGKFEFKSFASELAMDIGVGVRLDFSYFIFRIDFAQRLKDPELDKGHRWVPGNAKDWFNLIVNLGIDIHFNQLQMDVTTFAKAVFNKFPYPPTEGQNGSYGKFPNLYSNSLIGRHF
ncbi:MAG: hypothetical protein R2750_03275 [Bacteroidales bacterium]